MSNAAEQTHDNTSGAPIRRFDFARCSARIAAAQHMMNVAPTAATTAYWCRIWRARCRIYRIAARRELCLS